jgi:hypothetical protein
MFRDNFMTYKSNAVFVRICDLFNDAVNSSDCTL